MKNPVRTLLASLGAIDEKSVEPYFPRVRDRNDISVLRCRKSGVIFLDSTDHVSLDYYKERQRCAGGQSQAQLDRDLKVAVKIEDTTVVTPKLDDALRRETQYGDEIRGRRWLDVGTGGGRILDLLGPQASATTAIEPNRVLGEAVASRGHQVFQSLDDIPDETRFDVTTMFHVLEHLADPVRTLERIRSLLGDQGLLIAEVPHARDFLLEAMDCDAFRRFSLWSEHLVLHTRESLTKVLLASGFEDVKVVGYQRYPLANHLYWLRHGKPGGHEKWEFLDDPNLHQAYAAMLNSIDQTDSLIAYARR